MRIKKNLKSIIGAAITATALVSGSASAATFTNHTGCIVYAFSGDDGYTFVDVEKADGTHALGYYIGTNSVIATIIDNAKRFNQDATVSIDNETYKILYVQ